MSASACSFKFAEDPKVGTTPGDAKPASESCYGASQAEDAATLDSNYTTADEQCYSDSSSTEVPLYLYGGKAPDIALAAKALGNERRGTNSALEYFLQPSADQVTVPVIVMFDVLGFRIAGNHHTYTHAHIYTH